MAFTDWSITQEFYLFLLKTLPEGSTILEFGSGDGTQELSKHYKMFSIEDDSQWVNKFNSTYLHVPLIEYSKEVFPKGYDYFGEDNKWWYNPEILKQQMEKTQPKFDLLLVDGPKGYRGGLIDYIDLFTQDKNVPIIFDDTHDKYHFKLMELTSEYLNRPFENFKTGNKAHGIIL